MARTKKTDGMSIGWERSGSYPVRFADDVFGAGSGTLAEMLRGITGSDEPRVMLIADANVVQRTEGLGTNIGKFVKENGVRLVGTPVVIGGGEKAKFDGQQNARRTAAAAIEGRIGAGDAAIVIGGGSVLDFAGFVASQVRGGIPIVRIPTTVASMLDGAFAEYAALDMPGVKDALRVPCHPAGVVIDTKFASTVLDGVWRGGIGEMIRYAASADAALFRKIAKNVGTLRDRDSALMSELVKECVESRVRKGGCDFALWSASRLEAMSSYKLPHGYAVPIAMCIDCAYAVERSIMSESDQELVCRTLADSGALDGLQHSLYLLAQPESILRGLDAWRLNTGSEAVTLLSGVGKTVVEETPDRAVFDKVIRGFHAASSDEGGGEDGEVD